MKGAAIAARVAELKSAKSRSAAMAGAAAAGLTPGVDYCQVDFHYQDATLAAYVMADALRLGDSSDWFYATVTAQQADALADAWGLVLPSPQMVDKVWGEGAEAAPVILPAGPQMTSIAYAVQASAERQARDYQGAVSPCGDFWGQSGKWWVIIPRLWTDPRMKSRGANYGFFTHPTAPATPKGTAGPKPSATRKYTLWQEPGTRHSYTEFSDYSQTFRAFYQWAWLTQPGKPTALVNLKDVALGPLHPLITPTKMKLWHPRGGPKASAPGVAPGVARYNWS
jgi:hypothetical protein